MVGSCEYDSVNGEKFVISWAAIRPSWRIQLYEASSFAFFATVYQREVLLNNGYAIDSKLKSVENTEGAHEVDFIQVGCLKWLGSILLEFTQEFDILNPPI
jgi:hypothetical protein